MFWIVCEQLWDMSSFIRLKFRQLLANWWLWRNFSIFHGVNYDEVKNKLLPSLKKEGKKLEKEIKGEEDEFCQSELNKLHHG